MKRLVLLVTMLFIIGLLTADNLASPGYREAEIDAIHPRTNRNIDPPPDYSFFATPQDIVTNYYDYMPGSYIGSPLQVMPESGNAYIIFHSRETAAAQRREYLAYINADGQVNGTSFLGNNDVWEGYGSIDLDPDTNDPLAVYHIDFGQPTARVDLTYDMWHVLSGPGLVAQPFTVIANETMAGDITPFDDDSFVWPYIYVIKAPTYNTDGKRRALIFASNNTTHSGDPSENVLLAWADFDTSDLDTGSLVSLPWNYYTFPLLDAYNAGDPGWGRYNKSIAVSENGQVAMIGYLNADEFTDKRSRLTIFYNDNYGEGDWEVVQQNAGFTVDNPQNQDGSYYFDADEIFFDFVNSSHPHAAFDSMGRLHFIGEMVLGYISPDDGEHYLWAYWSYVKDAIYDPASGAITWQDIYPQSTNDDPTFPFLPWDVDQDGQVDEFDDEGTVLHELGWPVYWYVWDDAFHENLFKFATNPDNGWMAAVWVDGLKSRYFNESADEAYADWVTAPEICIAVSGYALFRNNGEQWTEPIRLNALETPELAGMIPEYVYPGSFIEDLGDDMGRLHLFFLDDTSYGSSVQGNGTADGGMMKYCAIDIDFPTYGVVDDACIPVWGEYDLHAFPNPFNPTTQVAFTLSQPGDVSVKIYNARGQLVKTLDNRPMAAGDHTLTWTGLDDNGAPVSSGVYFARVVGPNGSQAARMLLLK